ncbi:hypothetical protein AHAS_Ahas13G0321500 [Arachis hypogaea]
MSINASPLMVHLLPLMRFASTLSSVEVAKQELLEIQEGKSNLKAKEPLLQCIHAYREFMSCREQDDYEVVRKVGRGKYNEVFDLRAFTPPIMKNASSRSSNPSRRKSNAAVFSFSILFHFILSSYGNECCAGASMANFGPMSQSQSKKLMPNLDRQSTKVLNLTVLQRFNPFIAEILFTAAHVSFYEFNIETNQWSRKDVEGSLFVVKRNVQPQFQFIVMNRQNTDNLVENLLDFEYELKKPYLLYRNAAQEVNDIWFYNEDECEEDNILNGFVVILVELSFTSVTGLASKANIQLSSDRFAFNNMS